MTPVPADINKGTTPEWKKWYIVRNRIWPSLFSGQLKLLRENQM